MTRNRTVLAIDIGTKAGWALYQPKRALLWGTVEFKNHRFEGGGMKWIRFRAWLDEMGSSCGPDLVLFEEVRRHMGTDAAHIYGGFVAELTAWCELRGISYAAIPVGSIKKAATGRGNASKNDMVDAVRKLGYDVANHNEADAVAILLAHGVIGDVVTTDA